MALNLISNFAANLAQRNLSSAEQSVSTSLAKLSAGSRALAAKDDSAAVAVGSRLRAEVESLKPVTINAGQAISMLQVADGAMARIDDLLIRMKALAIQASSENISTSDRSMLNTEYFALRSEIDRVANISRQPGGDGGARGNPVILYRRQKQADKGVLQRSRHRRVLDLRRSGVEDADDHAK